MRVFHRLGDYKHKQRNRMKFLIRELGWDAVARGVREASCRRFRLKAARVPSLGSIRRWRTEPDWPRPVRAVASRRSRRASAPRQVQGPGIVPERRAGGAAAGDYVCVQWREHERAPAEQLGYIAGDGDRSRWAISRARRCGSWPISRAPTATAPCASPCDQGLLFRWVDARRTCAELYRRLAAAGLGLAGADTVADVASCPGAESCRLAVTQSRGLGRQLERHPARAARSRGRRPRPRHSYVLVRSCSARRACRGSGPGGCATTCSTVAMPSSRPPRTTLAMPALSRAVASSFSKESASSR